MLWLGLGLNYTAVSGFYYFLQLKLSIPSLVSLSLYLLLVLAPIVYWLGQTIPLTTNFFQNQHRTSRISAHALFWSTAGSFLGALLTSLVFFQFLGVAWTIIINCLLLFSLIILLKPHSAIRPWQLILLGSGLVSIKLMNIDIEKSLFQLTNNYANYRVVHSKTHKKYLQINMANSSSLTHDQQSAPYIEFLRTLLFEQMQLRHKKILVIGAGGFTLAAKGTHDNHVMYVDIDPNIQQFSEQYFLNQPIHGEFVGEDARLYLNHNSTRFDAIISDVYSHQSNIPASLLTQEYFQQLADHLHPSGILIVNVIANPWFQDHFSQRIANTIHRIFGFCAIVPLNWQTHETNMLYVCSKTIQDKQVYTDNRNTATLDFFKNLQPPRQVKPRSP